MPTRAEREKLALLEEKKVGKRGKETIVAREKGVARCEESGEDGNVDDEFFARRGVGGKRGRRR